MPKVTFVSQTGDRKTIDIDVGDNVMRGALDNDIDGIVGECGGGLACATCHCYVDTGWADKAGAVSSQIEREMLDMAEAEVRETSRLSCQIEMTPELDGLVVHLPDRQF